MEGMKIGIGTYALAWSIGVPGHKPPAPMDIYGFLEFASQQGFVVVQIADNLPLHLYSRDELKKIRDKLKALNIVLEVGTRGLMRENLDRYLEISSFFGSELLRVVIDTKNFTPSIEEINTIIRDLLPEIKERNIRLAIENHDRLKAKEFRDIILEADSPYVGICLDSVNSIGADEGFETVFNILAPYTINLHLKDYVIRRKSHMMGFDIYGTPAGSGMMPVKQVLATLQKFGQAKSVILELWPPPEASLKETILKEQEWVSESLRYLKTLTI